MDQPAKSHFGCYSCAFEAHIQVESVTSDEDSGVHFFLAQICPFSSPFRVSRTWIERGFLLCEPLTYRRNQVIFCCVNHLLMRFYVV